ncbi:MAG: DUF6478 family protein [Tabrizicola sp.]|jgi:hypothetical protein|nr:DUF6478 family protein [Tabrizicola sp.]
MAGRLAQVLNQWHLRRLRDHWSQVADQTAEADAFALRSIRAEARSLRRQIDRVIHETEHRLSLPAIGTGLPRQPLGTDWAWRADAWRGPLAQPGAVAETERTQISDDLALYHDCPLGEIAVRNLRNQDPAHRAPFGLALDVFGFRGSFLSLAMNLPDGAVQGLKSRHLIRLDAVIVADRPLRGFARLNVKNGPNVAQLVSALPQDGPDQMAEFDLAYGNIDESRIERAWLDLIFNNVAMSRITLRDVVISRRPRAEL